MDELSFRSATDLAAMIRSRAISSVELLDHFLTRVREKNPALNAVVTLDVERARERAREADAALARGESWGPLHGLPITIKDTFETAGLRTTAGFPPLSGHVPATNAIAVQRLVDAGAIVLGKTNTPTLAADWQSHNPIFGTTNNPWNRERTPGGSSDALVTLAAEAPADSLLPRVRLARCGTERHRDWLFANERRARLGAKLAAFFERFDVLLLPVNQVAAIAHDHSEPQHDRVVTIGGEPRPYFELLGWIATATATLHPATVAPIGRTVDGMPCGIQIVAPYLEDRTSIRFAELLAEVTGGFAPPP